MSYSTEPTTDAWRYFEQLDKEQAEVQANRAMFTEMFMDACSKGANCLAHGDAFTSRHWLKDAEGNVTDQFTTTTKLQPLHVTMGDMCGYEHISRIAFGALLACANQGQPEAVAAIKAMAVEYGKQKGDV